MIEAKNLSLVFLIIVGGMIALIIFSLKDPASKRILQHRVPELLGNVEARIDRLRFFEKNPGKPEWELSADKVQILEKESHTSLTNLHLTLVSTDKRTMKVKAQEGELENSSKNIEISGDVEITSDDGYVFQTEKLFWNAVKQEISTPTEVRLTGPNLLLSGDELLGYAQSQVFELKHVKAVFESY